MTIFEIQLNQNFKFDSDISFLKEDKFNKYFKINNSNKAFKDNEFKEFILNDYVLNIDMNSILSNDMMTPTSIPKYNNDKEILKSIMKLNITEAYKQHFKYNTSTKTTCEFFGVEQNIVLYPNWQLFYISLKDLKSSNYPEKKFMSYISRFEEVVENVFKDYIIRNIENYIKIENKSNLQKELYDELYNYQKKYFKDKKLLLDFLKYILELHFLFKENEKYKLMWNLESTYIRNTIYILIETFEISYTDIIQELNKLGVTLETFQGSMLNELYIDKKTYIGENNLIFLNKIQKFKNLFNKNFTNSEYLELLLNDEKIIDTLYSIVELEMRYFANKRSEDLISAILKGILLGIEEIIRDKIKCDDKNGIFRCIQKLSKDSELLDFFRDCIPQNAKDKDFFNGLSKLIKKDISIEKYLMIYNHTRNYVAHNIIDFEKMIYENSQERIVNTMDSVVFILIYLELNEFNNNENN